KNSDSHGGLLWRAILSRAGSSCRPGSAAATTHAVGGDFSGQCQAFALSWPQCLAAYCRGTARPCTAIQPTREDAGVPPPVISVLQPISSTRLRSGRSTTAPSTRVLML